MKNHIVPVLLLVVVLAFGCSSEDKGTDANGNGGPHGISLLGSYPIGGATGLYVSGNYAYISGDSGFYIIDISNPSSPSCVGFAQEPRGAEDIVVQSDHAYVADYRDGLVVVNVSNPNQPNIVGSYHNGDGKCWNLAVLGTTAYVANEDSGLWIIDITNSSNPKLVRNLYMKPRDLSLVASTLYVLDMGQALLRKFDASDPANPQHICSTSVPTGLHHALSLSASNSIVCITDDIWDTWETYGLRAFNAVDCSPRGVLPTPGYAGDVFVSGSYAYIADYGHGLRIVDIQNPMVPSVVDSSSIPARPEKVFVRTEYIYLTDHGSGVGMEGLYILRFVP